MLMQDFGEWRGPICGICRENLKGTDEPPSCSVSEAKRVVATLGWAAGPERVKLKYARTFTVGHSRD